MLFIRCEMCEETIFVYHLEFHMEKHIGINGTIELFKTQRRQEEDLAKQVEKDALLNLQDNERII